MRDSFKTDDEYSALFFAVNKYLQMITNDRFRRREYANLIAIDLVKSNNLTETFDEVIKPYLIDIMDTPQVKKTIESSRSMFNKKTKYNKTILCSKIDKYKDTLIKIRELIITYKAIIRNDILIKYKCNSATEYFKKKNLI